jgi:hypothetical protein
MTKFLVEYGSNPYLWIFLCFSVPILSVGSFAVICSYNNNKKIVNILAIIGLCISVLLFVLWGFLVMENENYKTKKEQQVYEQHISNFDSSALIGTQVIKIYKTSNDFHTYQTTGIKAGYRIVSVNTNDKNAVEVIFEKIK